MNRTAIIPNRCRLALLVFALAVVALLVTRCSRGRAEYHRRIAALRAAGEPVTAADFAALYPSPPPERDFRRLLRSVLPADNTDPGADPHLEVGPAWDRLRVLDNRAPLDPSLLEQMRVELASNAAPVELVLRTDLSRFGFVYEWTNAFNWEHDDSETCGDKILLRIELSRTLAMQAIYEAELGHDERAATALVRGFQMAHMPNLRGWIGAHGPLASESIMLSAVERTLNRAPLTEDDLRRLDEALPRPRDLLRETLFSERAWQLALWNQNTNLAVTLIRMTEIPGKGYDFHFSNPTILHAHDHVVCILRGYEGRLANLDRWVGRFAATRLPLREQLATVAVMDGDQRQVAGGRTNLIGRVRRLLDLDYGIRVTQEYRWEGFFQDHARNLAGLANAQAAVAIERWRLAHPGRLPDTLSELVPTYLASVPLDPYDGQPVRYKKLPVGYVVYSVGTGWTDHGEQSLSAITLTVER